MDKIYNMAKAVEEERLLEYLVPVEGTNLDRTSAWGTKWDISEPFMEHNIEDGVIRESSMGDDHPIVWTNCVGKGKAFYSAMGHKGKYFLEPLHLQVIKSGIIWAADKSAKCN